MDVTAWEHSQMDSHVDVTYVIRKGCSSIASRSMGATRADYNTSSIIQPYVKHYVYGWLVYVGDGIIKE